MTQLEVRQYFIQHNRGIQIQGYKEYFNNLINFYRKG